MLLNKEDARSLLKDFGLRATGPRIAVLKILYAAENALSCSEVLDQLGDTDWDPATIYRNLIKLKDVGIAVIVSRADGISRYALKKEGDDTHKHPHFFCNDCDTVSCLPLDLTMNVPMNEYWTNSIAQAMVQLRGTCPDCLTN